MLLCRVSLIRKMAKDHSCQNIPWMSHLMPKSKWNEQLCLQWSLQIMWQGKEENNLSHEKWSLDCVCINQWFVIWAWDHYQAFKHELEVPNLLINQEIMCNQVNLSFHLPAEMLLSVDVTMRLNTPFLLRGASSVQMASGGEGRVPGCFPGAQGIPEAGRVPGLCTCKTFSSLLPLAQNALSFHAGTESDALQELPERFMAFSLTSEHTTLQSHCNRTQDK